MNVALRNALELFRFVRAAIAGLLADMSVAWVLFAVLGASLIPSIAGGFLAGALLVYVLHETMTFRGPRNYRPPLRAALYMASLILTFLVRIGSATLLDRLPVEIQPPFLVIILATGVSFMFNFLFCKLVIFRSAHGWMGLRSHSIKLREHHGTHNRRH